MRGFALLVGAFLACAAALALLLLARETTSPSPPLSLSGPTFPAYPTQDPAIGALARAQLLALTPSPTATPAPTPTDAPLPTADGISSCNVARPGDLCHRLPPPTPTASPIPGCATVPAAWVGGELCVKPAPTGAPLPKVTKGK